MNTKIALLSPKGPLYRYGGGIWKKSLRYAPLTLTTLAALVPADLEARVEIYDEGIQFIPLDLEADLIGMTVITGSARRAYELADHYRARGQKVVLGGPHVTLVPEDAAPHADAIVTGYAEESWPRLLRDLAAGRLEKVYRQKSDLDLAGMPFARRELLPKSAYITRNVFEATRGCIHDCEFCVVPSAWGRTPLQKPVEEVVADIKQWGAKDAIFIDLNLFSNRRYAQQLFEALIPLNITWFGLSTVLIARNEEMVALAARSGCRGLLLGFESLIEKNVDSAGKTFTSPSEYPEVVRRLHKYGIAVQGCFVFGMDDDTPDIFLKTARFAVENRIDLPRFAIRTPFPGTPLYRRLDAEGRIFTKNWDLYDAQHVVFQPARMSVDQLYEGHVSAWRHAYSIPSIARRLRDVRHRPLIMLAANLGYRFYAGHLDRFRVHSPDLMAPVGLEKTAA